MTDTPKGIQEEFPPKLEEIIYGFEQLSLTPTTSPPDFVFVYYVTFLIYIDPQVCNQLSHFYTDKVLISHLERQKT